MTHAQCTTSAQLLARVKQLPNALEIYKKVVGDKVGDKRKNDEGAAGSARKCAAAAAARSRPRAAPSPRCPPPPHHRLPLLFTAARAA